MAGEREVRQNLDASGSIHLKAGPVGEHGSEPRCHDPRCPDDRPRLDLMRVAAPVLQCDRRPVDVDDSVFEQRLHTEALKRPEGPL